MEYRQIIADFVSKGLRMPRDIVMDMAMELGQGLKLLPGDLIFRRTAEDENETFRLYKIATLGFREDKAILTVHQPPHLSYLPEVEVIDFFYADPKFLPKIQFRLEQLSYYDQ